MDEPEEPQVLGNIPEIQKAGVGLFLNKESEKLKSLRPNLYVPCGVMGKLF